MNQLERIGDSTYLYIIPKTKQEILINVDKEVGDSEFRYNLAQKACSVFMAKKKPGSHREPIDRQFSLGNKKWGLKKDPRASLWERAGAKATTFVHAHADDNVIRLKVADRNPQQPHLFFSAYIECRPKSGAHKKEPERPSELSLHEFQQHVRGKETLGKEILPFEAPLFSDPFTKLATAAFQHYETQFTSKDNFVPKIAIFAWSS